MANVEIEPVAKEVPEKTSEARREVKVEEPSSDAKAMDDKKESSFSEAKLAKAIEQFTVGDLDIDDLMGNKVFQSLPDQHKTVVGLHLISKRLNALTLEYTRLMENNVHQAQRLLDDIKKFRAMQKILLTKLFGKLEEVQDKEKLEKELAQMGI